MHKYHVTSADQVTDSTVVLNLEPASVRKPFLFSPGQYAAISFYHKGRPTPARCFSIASSPTDQDTLRFGMRTKGRFTKSVANLKPGDVVKVRGPYGGFVLDIAGNDDVVFLAGGIGITPFMSMLSYATHVQASTRIVLFYSCQTQDDIPFLDELRSYEQNNPNIKVIFVVGHGDINQLIGLSAATGQLTPDLIDSVLTGGYENRTFYTCGPPPYMNAMVKTLKKKGVKQNHIITEAFAQGSQLQTGKVQSWPYNIYVISTASLILGSLAVTISDMLKTLPPQTLLNSANLAPTLTSSNSRQRDLDTLVNSLPPLATNAPATAAEQASEQAAQNDAAASAAAATAAASATTPAASVAPAPVVVQAPAPAPVQKTCTTTQSGVTTCV